MKSIYCFKFGVLLEVTQPALTLFRLYNWDNFKKGDKIYLDGELFGYFDNYTDGLVVINL